MNQTIPSERLADRSARMPNLLGSPMQSATPAFESSGRSTDLREKIRLEDKTSQDKSRQVLSPRRAVHGEEKRKKKERVGGGEERFK